MDIVILAGGYGTRLKGIWNKPKCLIPYQGQPLIEILINKALKLGPRKVFLLLGHRASEVVQWREEHCSHKEIMMMIDPIPGGGTAYALRTWLPLMKYPLMILNGDTIPLYDLTDVVNAFNNTTGRTVVAWANGRYAGTSLFGEYGMETIKASRETNLNAFVYASHVYRFKVSGFLDVGTPETFHKLQTQEKEQ